MVPNNQEQPPALDGSPAIAAPPSAERPWRVWQDGEWTILHVTAGGAETTASLTQEEAQTLAYYLVQHHRPIAENEALARANLDAIIADMGAPEDPREEIERSARMLETYGAECFPANAVGQVHMVRAMMESAAYSIRQFLATLNDGEAAKREPSSTLAADEGRRMNPSSPSQSKGGEG